MNKKFLIFGIVTLFAIALITATVVTYVSNTSKTDLTINQKMQTWIGNDESQTSISLNTFGGDDFNFVVNERNNGEHPAEVYNLLLKITAPVGSTFSGEEFTTISTVAEGDVTSFMKVIDPTTGLASPFADNNGAGDNVVLLMMSSTAQPAKFSFGAGNTHVSDITVTTALGITPGDYTIETCTINNLVGADCE
jgi:hypothetical protein